MKFGVFNNFGAKNSAPVFAAFCRGLARLGFDYASHDMDADVAVIWSTVWAGRMRSNYTVWQQYRRTARPVVVLEVGMLQRGATWKVGVNGTGQGAYPDHDLDSDRPAKLNLDLAAWREPGSDVLICLQRNDSEQWHGQPSTDQWLAQTISTLRSVTDRPIAVRAHPRQRVTVPQGCRSNMPLRVAGTYDDFDFASQLRTVWAVVNHNSGPGSQAIMLGVPAFVDRSSLAAPVGNLDISGIETPRRPDRESWLINLCHTEWTVTEIDQGIPIQRLLSRLQSS